MARASSVTATAADAFATSPSRGLPASFRGRLRHRGERGGEPRGPRHEAVGHGHQQVVVGHVHHVDGEALLRALAQAAGEERLLLADRRAHEQDGLELRPARRSSCRATARRRSGRASRGARKWWSMLSVPRPRASFAARCSSSSVSVGETSAPSAAGPCFATTSFRPVRDGLERLGPVHLDPGAVLAHHRAREPVLGVEALVGEAVAVREPALVDGLVLERQHAHHALLLHLHHEVRAQPVVRRDRLAARELPRAGASSGRASR